MCGEDRLSICNLAANYAEGEISQCIDFSPLFHRDLAGLIFSTVVHNISYVSWNFCHCTILSFARSLAGKLNFGVRMDIMGHFAVCF